MITVNCKRAFLSEAGHERLTLLLWYSGLFLIAMAFLFPILSGPWPSFYKESFAAIGLTLLTLAFTPSALSKASLFLILLASTVFFYFFSEHIFFIDDVILTAGYIISLALSIEIGRKLISLSNKNNTAEKAIFGFWVMIWIAATISSLIAIRQWLGIADSEFEFHLTSRRPYGNIGQPNLLSSLIFLAFGALLYFQQTEKASPFISLIAALFLTFSLAVIQSRISWIFIAFLSPYLVWRIKRNDINLPYSTALVIPVFFIISVFACLQFLQSSSPSFNFAERAQASGRLNIWSAMIHAIPISPWEGFGWRQTASAQLASPVPILEHGRLDYAHNIILDLIIWLGPLPGSAVISIAGAWLLIAFFRGKGVNPSCAWLALSGLLIHSLFEYPYAYTYFLIPFGVILGTSLPQKHTELKLPFYFWRISAVAMFATTCIAIHDYRIIERDAFNEHVRRAKVIGFPAEDMSQIILLQQLAAERESKTFTTSSPLTDKAASLLQRVTIRRPTLANLVRFALVQTNRKELQEACTTLSLIYKIYGRENSNEAYRLLSEKALLPCGSAETNKTPASYS